MAVQKLLQKETAKSDDKSLISNLPAVAIAKEGPPITNIPITNLPAEATADKPITSLPAVAIAKADKPITIPIFTIPTPLYPMLLPERIFQIQKRPTLAKEPIAEKIKPVQDQRFSFGLSLVGSAYQQSDTVGRWAGWTLGAFGDYRLNNNWSLMLGVQARFVPGHTAQGDSSNPNQVENLRYSFGYRSEEWKRETRGLHFLEIPISAHWHKGPWALEAGGAAGMLLAVQDRTEYTVESSLEEPKTTVTKFVKGNSEPYNQNYFSAFAGAGYRLNNRISLMTKAQYRFTPVFKTLGEGLKNKGLGNVELGLRLRLF
ncbi:MAG: outer membrane beta-barrel protein [Lewinellaceae bacterium]|nr:outer membrane beta-barrel protein [Lewinellaceae bacterium]